MTENSSGSSKSEKIIPDTVIDTLARCLLPKIREYYESEDGKKEFKNWKHTH